MCAANGNSNSCPFGLIKRMERHVVSTDSGGASMTSRFLTLGTSFSISALTGKYSPQRTGVPRIFFFSKTLTFKPFFERWTAAERPPGPPPTITTSYLLPFKSPAPLLYVQCETFGRSDLCVWPSSQLVVQFANRFIMRARRVDGNSIV